MSRCFPFPPPGYEKLRVEDVTLLVKEKDKELKEKKHKKHKDKEEKDGRKKRKEQHKEKDKEHKHKDRDKKNGKKRSRDEKEFEGNRPTVEKVGTNSPESSCVQELEPRINFVDGATRSHPAVASRSNGVYRTEAKVSIVHNIKTEERGCEVAGIVDTRKTAHLEGLERNRYCGKDNVDDRKKILSKDEDRNNPIKVERLKKESVNVKLSRTRQNGSDITDNTKHFNFKMSNNASEVISGKRKEPEANGILHDNEMRPSKLPRTDAPSSQSTTKIGRNLTSTTITLSASKQAPTNGVKLDGEERNSIQKVSTQSPPVSNKSPSTGVKLMGPTRGQSPLGVTKPSIPSKANGAIGAQKSPFGPTKPPLSIGKVHGKMGCRESHMSSTKPPSTAGKVAMSAHGSPPFTANPLPQIVKFSEKVNCQESAKPPLTPRKVNATTGPLESPLIATKAILPHVEKAPETEELAKPPLTPGKVAGPAGPHGPPSVSKKPPSTSKKEKRKDKSSKPRSPHPDTKYLSQILLLPKMEELSEFDDPDWLFVSKSYPSKECDASEDGEEQVWSKAVHIKSADVYALPYVIPY